MVYLGSYNLQLLDHLLRFVVATLSTLSRNLWVPDSFALQRRFSANSLDLSNKKYHGIECSDGNLPGYWYRKFSVSPQFQICEKIFVEDAKKDTAATNKGSYCTGRGNWSFFSMCFRRKCRAKSDLQSPVSRFIGACLFYSLRVNMPDGSGFVLQPQNMFY